MKFKLTLIALTGMLMFGFTSVKAQTADTVFTASHLEAAENYLVATGVNTKFGQITDNMISTFSTQLPENSRAAFAEVMKKFMAKYYTWDTLKVTLGKMYAAEFTEAELKQLTKFFNTPLGKKYGEKSVELAQKGMLVGQQIIRDHHAELEQMMRDALPAKN
jgi:hypothetical protein